jgi:hypothetical protein
MRKKAIRVLPLDHKGIMYKACKHDRLKNKEDSKDKSKDESDKDSKESEESKSERE